MLLTSIVAELSWCAYPLTITDFASGYLVACTKLGRACPTVPGKRAAA